MFKAAFVLVLLAVGCQSQGIISCTGFSNSFTLQSVVISNLINTDTTSLVLETQSPGMSMTIQYAGTGLGSVSAFQGAVTFDRVIEFKDTGAPGYDGEEIVKETQLDFTFSPPDDCAATTTAMNFTAVADSKEWFTLQCYVVKARRAIGDVEIIPTQTKCDVIIQDYPYASSENRLALGGSYWYQSVAIFTGTDLLVGLDGLAVSVGNGDRSIAFNWVTNAQTLSGDIDVIFTQPDVTGGIEISGFDRSENMFFTFGEAGSSFINWDPSFGLVEGSGVGPTAAPAKASNTNNIVAASALTVAFVALVALF